MTRSLALQDGRFRLIWALLLWEGEVTNARLRKILSLETVQISRLLSSFLAAYPDIVHWDRSKKRYWHTNVPDKNFDGPTQEEYWSFLEGAGVVPEWFDRAPKLLVTPGPEVYAAVHQACSGKLVLDVNYASMRMPDGEQRQVFPCGVANVGDRWVVRAWCPRRFKYIDLLMDRMLTARIGGKARPMLEPDRSWTSYILLQLKAHEALPAAYAKLVERYRFNGAASIEIRVRESLVPYVLRHFRASVNPKRERPPMFELQVVNAAEVPILAFPEIGLTISELESMEDATLTTEGELTVRASPAL